MPSGLCERGVARVSRAVCSERLGFGDGRGELIVGMGRTLGGGLLAVLDDFQADFVAHPDIPSNTPWLRVDPYPARTKLLTRTMPAIGDLDGDGRDEITVSFGRGSRGIVAILQDAIDGHDSGRRIRRDRCRNNQDLPGASFLIDRSNCSLP